MLHLQLHPECPACGRILNVPACGRILNVPACSYILKVPFDLEDNNGIVYVWIGKRADADEARLTEEIADDMFGVRRDSIGRFRLVDSGHFPLGSSIGMPLPSWLCTPPSLIYNARQLESASILMLEKASIF